MAVATSVQTLTDKLKAMLADEELTITHQRSTGQIRRCVESLQNLMLSLTPDQEIHIVEKLEKNRDLLGRIYAAEDCVDTFTVNVQQQQLHRRRAVFFAGPLRRASISRQIRLVGGQMKELAGKMEEILVTLPELSRNIGEPSFQDGF
ncbi:unnamed protein product [Linum trigynum]|uniref:Uncharacterized protein n=1 Tax=Linum trigynum TaxID=586398 RepID=A0AAV2FIW1_9ROSI